MPWFSYNFPSDPSQPGSYSLVSGTPSCTGTTLCAIYATSEQGSVPARPVITNDLQTAIGNALNGIITAGVTRLRPNP